MGQVTTVRQIHPKNHITRLHHGHEGGHIGPGARMGLDIGIIGIKKCLCPFNGKIFRGIGKGASAVVPF